MKVLHLSTSDIEGGAARATYRLHRGLQTAGITSQMLVRAKLNIDSSTIADRSLLTKLGPPLSGIPLRLYPNRDRAMFSVQWVSDTITAKAIQLNPDVMVLHWICNGFLQVESLPKFQKPLLWVLHDMWAFTGGCHYSRDCYRYKESCGACPHLKSDRNWDISNWVWQRKAKAWNNLNLTIVSPSSWLAACAKASSLFANSRIEIIPHGLDLEIYKPVGASWARDLLNLPQDKRLILFGASPGTAGDTRKGFQYLAPALRKLSQFEEQHQLELVIFGATQPENPPNLGFKIHYLGQFHDDLSLSLVYSAADVMVVPSVQEAFGQTASESLACGTPVVAFDATGLKDIVEHRQNGYLANPFEVDDLAQGIAWVLEDRERWQILSIAARKKAEREFALTIQADRYISLIDDILSRA
ncbi:MAG: glycosyltransferase family 4 protein [Chroococcidiopsidaceae cyanobacterium CP_BM_RX_35]|nr:glycosyltransferase family 4 protein [Chroococcidiopsidaceae cyanobacterium CP_BM_RX_35]